MEINSFSNFSYVVNATSEKSGYKEVLVHFGYNSYGITRKVYIQDVPGTDYIAEAKKIIDQEMSSGKLASYSRKYIKKSKKKKSDKYTNWLRVSMTCAIASLIYAGTSIGLYCGKGLVPGPTPITTFKVIFDLDGCSYEGSDTVEKDQTYTCTIHPDSPNEKEVNIFNITMAGEKLTYQTDYTFINDKLDITKPATGDITIAATIRDKTFNVFWSAPGCNVEAEGTVARNHSYECKIEPQDPFTYSEVIAITMGGTPLERGAEYTYDYISHILKISKDATGNIVIVANALPIIPTTLDVYNYTPGCTFSGSKVAKLGDDYTCTIAAKKAPTEEPHVVAVKVGSKLLLNEGTDYTFNKGTLTIPNVSYDEYITIIAKAQPASSAYKVAAQCTECTFIPAKTTIGAGEKGLLGTFSASKSFVNEINLTVTMGGTFLVESNDYHIENDNQLYLDKEADGDICVSAINRSIITNKYAVSVSKPDGCTFDGDFTVDKDDTYTCSFTPSAGQVVQIASVIMDGHPLSCEGANPSYTWIKSPVTAAGDKGEMKLTINQKATGNIVIVVAMEDFSSTIFNVEHNLFETKLISGEPTVKANSTYTCKVAVNDDLIGIKEPRTLLIMMGGAKLTPTTDYTFTKESSSNNYVLDIIKPAFGFISISICATQIDKDNYNIEVLSYGCTNNAPQHVPSGTTGLNIVIKPENVSNIVEVFMITMGGRSLTLGSDYTFDGETISFLTAITGDLSIAATSRPHDRITAIGIVNADGEVTGLDCDKDTKGIVQDVIIPTAVDSSINNAKITVNSIPFGLLNGCSKIETLTIPFIGHTLESENYEAILGWIFGDSIYDGVGSLTWQTFYTDKSEEAQYYKITKAAIPTSLTTVTVNGGYIPKGAFSACRFIENVTFNDFVDDGHGATIGAYAFYNCTSLKYVTFPKVTTKFTKKVDTIEWRAFQGCVLLRTFDLTYVDDIFHNAFNGCDGMQGIYIPATLQHIGADAFANITLSTVICALTRDEVAGKISEGSWKSNWIADTALVIYGFYSENIYQDGDYRFIIIRKDSSETPSYGACIIEYTGDDRTPGLGITIPDTLTGPDNEEYPVLEIGAQVFFGYTRLETVNFNCTQLRVIDNYCFTSCNSLKNISTLKNTALTTLGTYAFDRCVNLTIDDSTTKTFPSTLKTIGKYAFAYCDDGLDVGDPNKHSMKIDLSNTSVKVLSEGLFYQSNNLLSFISPTYTEDLGVNTFEGCKDLDTMHLSVCGFDEIPDKAFKECKSLKSFHLINTDTVKLGRIGQEAFEACFNLSDLDLTLDGVAVIGNSAFKGCHALTSINWKLPVLGTFGDNVFENCSTLASVTLEAPNLKEISNNAFLDCTALNSFTLKAKSGSTQLDNLTKIGNAAFKRTILSKVDMNTPALTKIGNEAFSECTSLTDVHFIAPELTTIGDEAFYNCDKLKTCLIDKSSASHELTELTTIGDSVFENCKSLTKVFYNDGTRNYVPECITSIGNFAFASCTSMTKIRFTYNETYHPKHTNMFIGAQIFEKWTTADSIEIDVAWTHKQYDVDSTRMTYWGWNLSAKSTWSEHFYCGAATGTNDVVIYVYNA